jgi:hypothetical protein
MMMVPVTMVMPMMMTMPVVMATPCVMLVPFFVRMIMRMGVGMIFVVVMMCHATSISPRRPSANAFWQNAAQI